MQLNGTYNPRSDKGPIRDAVASVLREHGGDGEAARQSLRFFGPPHRLRTAKAIAELSEAFNLDLSRWGMGS